MDPVTGIRAKLGLNVSSVEYINAKKRMHELNTIVTGHFRKYDELISPTTIMQAIEVDNSSVGN